MEQLHIEALRSRWKTPGGLKVKEMILGLISDPDNYKSEKWFEIFKELPHANELPKPNDMRGIDLSGKTFTKIEASDVDFSGAKLDLCTFEAGQLGFARFRYASLKNSFFNHCLLLSICAEYACMDNVRFINCDITSSQFENTTFRNAHFENCTMVSLRAKGANFEGVTFRNTRFGPHLQNTLFDHADLEGQNLSLCYFNDASFRSANLKNANASKANFENANFENADLRNTDFTGSNLKGASFTGANTEGTIFTDVTR